MSTLRVNRQDVLLVEGPFDAILLWQQGYSTIALNGTAIKDEWLPQLARFTTVYVWFDADAPGREAALAAAKKLGISSRLIQLPEGVEAPADFVEKRHTQEEFEQLLAKAQDIIEYQISQIPEGVDRLSLADKLRPILEQLLDIDPAKAEAYLKYRIVPRFGLAERDLNAYRSTLNHLRKKLRQKAKQNAAATQKCEDASAQPGKSEMSPEDKEEALRFLRDPMLVGRICQDITKLGVVGEDRTKGFIYVAMTSRKMDKTINLDVRAATGVGKNFIAGRISQMMPEEDVVVLSRITSHYADYLNEDAWKGKVVIIKERAGAEDADYMDCTPMIGQVGLGGVWRGNPLFSCISTKLSKSFGEW